MGTSRYMSPEQVRGLAVDARTDIWSLGVVLYEMVATRVPFEGATTSDVIVSIGARTSTSRTILARSASRVAADHRQSIAQRSGGALSDGEGVADRCAESQTGCGVRG